MTVFLLILFPFVAHAREGFSHSESIGADMFAHAGRQYDDGAMGSVYADFEGRYDFDKETGISLNLDAIIGFNRPNDDYNNGKWGKELYAIIDSRYGRLMIGETWNVAGQLAVTAPNAGNIMVGDFYANPNHERSRHATYFGTLNSTAIDTDGVAPKLTYITPEFYGTYAGVTYVNDIDNRRGLVNRELSYTDSRGYVASIRKSEEIYGFDVAASLGYGVFHETDKEMSAGVSLSKGGWTLASSYRKTYVDGTKNPLDANLSDNYREGYAWDAGVGYEIGPYEVSLSYFDSKASNGEAEDKIILLSNQFQINKQVKVSLSAAHAKSRGREESEGYAFIAGLGLSL